MAGEIFISYRWTDAQWFAQALYEALNSRYPIDTVFMDVRDTPPGNLIRVTVREQVARCRVLLAVVGEGWLTAADSAGRRRLDDPNDLVRFEIGTALELGRAVIPVMVGDVPMPREEDLPDRERSPAAPGLKEFANRTTISFSHGNFASSTQSLLAALAELNLTPVKASDRRLDHPKMGTPPSGPAETNFVRALAKAYIDIRPTAEDPLTESQLARRKVVKDAYLTLQAHKKTLGNSVPVRLAIPCPSINPLTPLCSNLMQAGATYDGLRWPIGHQYVITCHERIFPESEGLMSDIPERFMANDHVFETVLALERGLLVSVLDAFISHPPNIFDRGTGDTATAAGALINDLAVRAAITRLLKYRVATWSASDLPSKAMAATFPIPKSHPVSLVLIRLLKNHLADIRFDADFLGSIYRSLGGRKLVVLQDLDDLRQNGIPHILFLEEFIAKFGFLYRANRSPRE